MTHHHNPIHNKATASDWLLHDPLGWDVYDAIDPIDDNVSTYPSVAVTANPVNFNDPDNFNDANNFNDPNNTDTTMTPHLNIAQQNPQPVIAFDGDTSRANPHFIPLLPTPIHRGETGRQLIMDTETTGLDALKGDRIVEVGIVEMINRKLTGEKLHVYINPQRPMDDEVIRIHGITEAFLADKPTFDKVAQPLYDFMLGAEIIAHNASFDMNFLNMEFAKVGLSDFAQRVQVTDSFAMAKQQYPGQKNSLDALVRRLNVGKMERTFHGALLDAEILAEVYLAMTGGQVSLAIDEDNQRKDGGAHLDFSALASQLVLAQTYDSEHLSWVTQQLKTYPNVLQTQGIERLHHLQDHLQDTPIFAVLQRHAANLNTQALPNFASHLFIGRP